MALLLAAPAWGQVTVPFLGYFSDGARIRPAHGIAASSVAGRPIETGIELGRIAPAPGADWLLVSVTGSGEVAILSPGRGLTPVSGATPGPDAIHMSPRGSAAALWFAPGRRVQIVKGLPDAPQVREIDLAWLGDGPGTLAVSDNGEWVAGAWPDAVRAFGPLGEAVWHGLEGVRAISFFHGSGRLAAATSGGVHVLASPGGTFELLFETGDLPEPLAVGLTGDNRRAVVMGAGGRLAAANLETGAVASAECLCTPLGLFRLNRSVFRITGLEHRGFKLFDAESGELLVAPLGAEEAEQ
jgi:hypothetical protein